MNEEQQEKLGAWAIVELFGHTRIAGFVSEYQVGGSAFVRVDVPSFDSAQDGGEQTGAFTKLFGPSAIYSISFTDEATARAAVGVIRPKPISIFILTAPALTAGRVMPAREDVEKYHEGYYDDPDADVQDDEDDDEGDADPDQTADNRGW